MRRLLPRCGLAIALLSGCQRDGAPAATAVGAASMIETPAPSGTTTPSLTYDRDGALLLSWTERAADSSLAVRVAAYRDEHWDSTRTIAAQRPFFANWADFPAVVTLPNGDWGAHWLERDGTGKYAYGIRFVRSTDAGRHWSDPIAPHTDGLAAEHGFVALWAEGADGVGLAWLDGRKSAMPDSAREMTVRTAVIAPDGTRRDEALLDARSCDCCQVASTATTNGRVVVYRDRTTEEIRDIVAVRRTATGWTAPTPVHQDGWHYPGCPVNGPAITARGDTVVVAWYTAAHDTARVLVARSVDGGATFAPPVRVDGGDPLGRVALALDAAGDPIVVWMERTTPETSAILVRRITGTAQSVPVRVGTTSAARQSGFPRVAVWQDTLAVAWTDVAARSTAPEVRLARIPLLSSPRP
ncbi:MAG: sialidase family protein [Gemmatimonadaceae bacterium]